MSGFLPKPTTPILQRGHPQACGLIAAWPLVEGAGNYTRNVAAPGIGDGLGGRFVAGSASGNPPWVNSPYGYCADFSIGAVTYATSQWISTASIPFTVLTTAICTTLPGAATYRCLLAMRGSGTPAITVSLGNAAGNNISTAWNGNSSEYDANTGMTPTVGVPFCVAAVFTAAGPSLYFTDASGPGSFKTWSLSETLTSPISLTGGSWSWYTLGNDSFSLGRYWPGKILEMRLYQGVAFSINEFMQYAFDPFAIYRKPSRLENVAAPAAPPVFRPGQYDDQLSLTQAGWFDPLL